MWAIILAAVLTSFVAPAPADTGPSPVRPGGRLQLTRRATHLAERASRRGRITDACAEAIRRVTPVLP